MINVCPSRPLRFAALASLLCAAPVALLGTPARADKAPSSAAQALAKAAAPHLTKSALRTTNPAISDAAFNLKWKAALASPLLFIRSFPAGYHASLKDAPPPPGAEALCVGDAHPANFGFLHLGGKTVFGYNDLDDSGSCPVAYDALRYFIALKLLTGDDGMVKDILERYVDAVKDPSRGSGVPKSTEPDWGKVASKGLGENTKGDKIVGSEVGAPQASDKAAVLAALAGDARTKGLKVLDVADIARDSGGSGGLARFWVLAQKGSARVLLELKESTKPGVEWGRHTKTLPAASRLGTLKSAFWGGPNNDDWYGLQVGKKSFLVRDRLGKKSLDVESLGGKDKKDVLQAQASELARIHRAAWGAVKKDDLRAWLLDNTDALGKVWKDAYAAGKK
jgi:hypothetical protein